MFSKVDFSSSEVQIIFIGLIVVCIVVTILLFILFRLFKLVIPKSKIYDDDYIQKSIRNVVFLRKASVIVFIMLLLYFGGEWLIIKKVDLSFFNCLLFIVLFVSMLIAIPPSYLIGRKTRSYRQPGHPGIWKSYYRGDDIRRKIAMKKML